MRVLQVGVSNIILEGDIILLFKVIYCKDNLRNRERVVKVLVNLVRYLGYKKLGRVFFKMLRGFGETRVLIQKVWG